MLERPQSTFLHSFYFLRRAVGIMGMALPWVLVVCVLLGSGGEELLSSVSASYYTGMRDVFVGCLWAIGFFLIFYRSNTVDNYLTTAAGIAAILVALVPTKPPPPTIPTAVQNLAGTVHIVVAGVFFSILALLAIWRFTKPERTYEPTVDRKPQRNVVYRACGYVIAACLLGAFVFGFLLEGPSRGWHPVLIFEGIAIVAFGVAWLIKGNTFLRDT